MGFQYPRLALLWIELFWNAFAGPPQMQSVSYRHVSCLGTCIYKHGTLSPLISCDQTVKQMFQMWSSRGYLHLSCLINVSLPTRCFAISFHALQKNLSIFKKVDIQQPNWFLMCRKISTSETWNLINKEFLHTSSLLPCWSMLPVNLERDMLQLFYILPILRDCITNGHLLICDL